MYIFEAKNIVKRYSNHLALDNLSVSVPDNSIFGLLGPNGAGKTTLIRIINQITAPDKGELFFNGKKLNSEDIYNIGYLPEERGLYKKMKVGEQAVYLARLKGLSKKDALKKLKFWFEKFSIKEWWGKKVEELSKGMQQKVQFIITILHEPKLLIFDEPFSGFDPINTNLLKEEILNLRKNGATIIFSTHNMASVEEICDNIALINNSRKVLEGNINDIKKEYFDNTFEVKFDENFNSMEASITADYKILEHKKEKNISILKIKLLSEISRNELISKLINFGNIISFNEIIPSMNEIFIKIVGETNEEKK